MRDGKGIDIVKFSLIEDRSKAFDKVSHSALLVNLRTEMLVYLLMFLGYWFANPRSCVRWRSNLILQADR